VSDINNLIKEYISRMSSDEAERFIEWLLAAYVFWRISGTIWEEVCDRPLNKNTVELKEMFERIRRATE